MNNKTLQTAALKKTSQFILLDKLNVETSFKWFILIASYSFLAYKLITFDRYEVLANEWSQLSITQFWWLAMVLVLLPANWLLEAKKWQMFVSKIQKITLFFAIKAVLSGIFTGFFTPNRVGELVGRVSFLKNENRKSGVTLSVLNSLTQNIIMAFFGIPACILFFLSQNETLNTEIIRYLLLLIISLILFGWLYFNLPQLSHRLKSNRISAAVSSFSNCLSDFSVQDLFKIMLVTLMRYVVFCAQFYFMLRFFNVGLDFWQAFIAIPTTYLFVTFTPSLAFSEAAVRSSYAVLIIGAFSSPEIPIILAGVSIWIVNFVLPMLSGSLIMVKSKTF
ncbi:MAG: flippase-like domain-containing protein [Paludibacter sp.]|nr:flippase-like domain-containing protein [Paludibacter sp.]